VGSVLAERWHVDRLMAEGGMSRIYVGHPLDGAGLIAIKQALDEPELLRGEYETLQHLQHASLPRVLAFIERGAQGGPYLVEEFVAGDTLQAMVERRGRFTPDEALQMVAQLLDVLGYLHRHHIIYRDLKPENLLMTSSDKLRLVDFGAARLWKPGATRDTIPLGTPGFAPPEQYGTAQSDARSDLYSVGALMHYLLSGEDPRERAPWSFPPLREMAQDVPPHLADAVARALRTEPARRFQTADDMRRALSGAGAGDDTTSTDADDASPDGLLHGFKQRLHHGGLWSRWKHFAIEIYRTGVCFLQGDERRSYRWDQVVGARVIYHADGRPKVADITVSTPAQPHGNEHLDATWPGFDVSLHAIIDSAGLIETQAAWGDFSYVGTTVKTFGRA
jgi:serine/threonine protein kinase